MQEDRKKKEKEDDSEDVLDLDIDEEEEEFEKKLTEHETYHHKHEKPQNENQDNDLVNIRNEKSRERHHQSHEKHEESHRHHEHENHGHDQKSDSSHEQTQTHNGHDNPSIPETISSFKVDSHKHYEDSDVFKIKKGDFWKFATFILIAIIVILGFSYFRGGFGGFTGNVIGENPQPAAGQPGEVAQVQVSADDDAIKGSKDAPVTIIEFSDYECPFCARFFAQTLNQLESEYIDTGKVRLVYRDFPLSNIHPQAQKAAEAAECAGEQEKYFEMHDKLFEEGVQGGANLFKQYANDLGLNTNSFNECLDSGSMANEVRKDFLDGQSAGVQGTPAFFINGKIISGAQPFQVFQQAIEAELAL